MRNITLTCPSCSTPDRCVGDPDEKNEGHTGDWYCFACKRSGSFQINFSHNPQTQNAQ